MAWSGHSAFSKNQLSKGKQVGNTMQTRDGINLKLVLLPNVLQHKRGRISKISYVTKDHTASPCSPNLAWNLLHIKDIWISSCFTMHLLRMPNYIWRVQLVYACNVIWTGELLQTNSQELVSTHLCSKTNNNQQAQTIAFSIIAFQSYPEMQEMWYAFNLRKVNSLSYNAISVNSLPEVYLNTVLIAETSGLYFLKILCTEKDKRQNIQL